MQDSIEERILISDICDKSSKYLKDYQVKKIYQAYSLAVEAHDGQYRKSGEAYVFHPLSVAMILIELKVDCESIIAAILHDCIEDTSVTKKEIATQFGDEVAHIVDGVSKLDGIEIKSVNEKQAKNFRKLLLAASKDIRVIVIKLADRLHNMRTISSMSRSSQIRIAKETEDIYVPISRRIGLGKITKELKLLVFKTIRPLRYSVISEKLKVKFKKNTSLLDKVIEIFTKQLTEAGIKSEISGREKDLVSIYNKMRDKKLHFAEVLDLYGLRIIVDSVANCYSALGIVHNFCKPVPGKFKDYIALPKNNGYQSLHTVIFGNNRQSIEVQIRTKDMENIASYGVASHWYYKNNSANIIAPQWLGSLLNSENDDDDIFVERIKAEMFKNDVFVFTPNGDIIKLPYNSTALDFAYNVHTLIGNRSVRAKIDSINTALSTEIKSGQTIEIITQKDIAVNVSWLDIVTTIKAKNAVKSTLKKHFKKDLSWHGKKILTDVLYYNGINIDKVEDWNNCFELCLVDSKQELFIKIALKEVLISKILGSLSNDNFVEIIDSSIENSQNIKNICANCCYPIPGDDVIGVLNSNSEIKIHRKNCTAVNNNSNIYAIEWHTSDKDIFKARLICDVGSKRGTLAEVANIVNNMEINISGVKLHDNSLIELIIDVNNLVFLRIIMSKLLESNLVASVKRDFFKIN